MDRSARLLAVTALVAAGLMFAATAAHAVIDPAATLGCLTSNVGELTTLVDPSGPGMTAEIPATHCLAP
ncbi:hypothetical protein FE391_18815 [Nonomuraea sp. KC401]|uniref:hypothetical protein n=1 Tax=unclassified Nonomuraea TaxID=2593643 RepID=UPI0010FF2741|nr:MULTISPECIES: hypothetical protein [unclassified Nonomuraea]NBE97008.1 hypothetical protein [Nonomuraea sp. K271]TLF71606.1 hypothetical protein FE391_18815 [Nonomuraea sp. KC401]